MDFRQVTPGEVAWVAKEINDRPRKILDWARPVDLLAEHSNVNGVAESA